MLNPFDDWSKYGHLAAPYELLVEERYDGSHVLIMLYRGQVGESFELRREIRSRSLVGSAPVVTRFMMDVILDMRSQLREELAFQYDTPNARLWAAETLNMDGALLGAPLPQEILDQWARHGNIGVSLGDPKEEQAIEAAREKREKEEMARIARVAPTQTKKKRVPICPVHDTPFEFDKDKNEWFCTQPRKDGKPGQTCNLRRGPRLERGNGEMVLGEGKVGVHFVAVAEGEYPRVVLVAANNVAIDVTDLVSFSDIVNGTKVKEAYTQSVTSRVDMHHVDRPAIVIPLTFEGFTITGAGSNG